METHEIITASILISTALICFLSCAIIRSYLINKPLGKQILLDRFLLEFIKAYQGLVLVTNYLFYFMAIPLPFGPDMAQIGFYAANFAMDYWLIWLTSVVVVKYLTIFHRHIFELGDRTDSQIIHLAKIINWSIFLALFCTEHLFIQEVESSAFYQFLLDKNNAPEKLRSIPKTSIVLVIIAILAIIHLQVRMEITGMKKSPKKMKKVHKNILRLIVIVVSGTISYVMYALATVELEDRFTRITHGCIVPIFTASVPPILFIINNPNMLKFAVKKMLLRCDTHEIDTNLA